MAGDIKAKLMAQNLGPHQNLSFDESLSSLKMAIYGSNGNGKTFLSRVFRCLNQVDIEESIKNSNKLISFGKSGSQFSISINNSKDEIKPVRTLSISLEKNKQPIIKNETGYIFHTFNSDYVQENLEAINYKPEGTIDGYILGKDVIDLTKEKSQQEQLLKEIQSHNAQLQTAINNAKAELDTLGINKAITEYKSLNFENLLNGLVDYEVSESFEELKRQNTTLNTLPDDLPDIQTLSVESNIEFLEGIKKHLATKHNKSHFSEEFKNKIKRKQQFVEDGVELITDSTCPFCEQSFSTDALHLIDEYTKYLSDQEAFVNKESSNYLKQLLSLRKQLEIYCSTYLKIKDKFNKLKEYLPSYKNKLLNDIKQIDEIISAFEDIENWLNAKKENIENVIEVSKLFGIELISSYVTQLIAQARMNNRLIFEINQTKSNLNKEKLGIKKNLCIARHESVATKESELIDQIHHKHQELKLLENDITQKENKIKTSKKSKISETFQFFLNEFFAGKYTFDPINFCLKLNENNLIENASEVLSEGEKSIVAFCFYLAETHRKISITDDYEKLFFIIDDPITSLDFHYVYSVAQIIRSFDKKFEIKSSRFLILTHNIEFISILMRNAIVKDQFILKKEKLVHLKKDLIMPYEAHLRDIYDVSKGSAPSHTIPNSIRHIIETINKFESPNEDLKTYFENQAALQANAFLYSLIHDSSHGVLRIEKPYTDEMIVKGCKELMEFISKKYGGQIKQLEKA